MAAISERLRERVPLGGLIKRLLPRSLLGRSLMIIVTPLIVVQIVSAWVFFDRHWDTVSTRLARGLAGDISATIELMREDTTPEGRQAIFAFVAGNFGFTADFREGAILKNAPEPDSGQLERVLRDALMDRMQRPIHLDDRPERDVLIDIQLPDGVLHIVAPKKRLFTSTTYLFVAMMTGSSLILFAIAMLFMRNQVRPINRLAAAADALGKGREVPSFRIQGATEVRQAATAFNLMRNRLQRQVAQRTEMLAGVSHDLRTPLTRMKLQLAMMGDAQGISDLRDDVREMERMVEGYLAFARGEGTEQPARTNLREVLDDVTAAARRQGADITLSSEGAMTLTVRREAMRRCLANIVGNATRHAKRVEISARRAADMIEICIDDDGPGIPADQREAVFRPFQRLDQSRNAETGGVGLGLTIARDVVHGHGGEIFLEDSPLGGLRARIRLPV